MMGHDVEAHVRPRHRRKDGHDGHNDREAREAWEGEREMPQRATAVDPVHGSTDSSLPAPPRASGWSLHPNSRYAQRILRSGGAVAPSPLEGPAGQKKTRSPPAVS